MKGGREVEEVMTEEKKINTIDFNVERKQIRTKSGFQVNNQC